jgi:hypothetical protein
MPTPWLDVPLADYEAHMALPSVGLATLLADHLQRTVERYARSSLALIGCAGGNGLERPVLRRLERIVAIDVNPQFLRETGRRHAAQLPGLELVCADVSAGDLHTDPVELVHAALLFEYVAVPAALGALKRICVPGGALAAVLQLEYRGPTSASGAASLERLAAATSLVVPAEFCAQAVEAGWSLEDSRVIGAPSGLQLASLLFRA